MMEDRLMSVENMCEYLGISRDTIYKWIEEKGLPAYRLGRLWKFKAGEVDEWVKKRGTYKMGGQHGKSNEKSKTKGR